MSNKISNALLEAADILTESNYKDDEIKWIQNNEKRKEYRRMIHSNIKKIDEEIKQTDIKDKEKMNELNDKRQKYVKLALYSL